MDVKKIYEDADFFSSVVPEGAILTFNALVNGQVVTRYKDSSGSFGTLSGSEIDEAMKKAVAAVERLGGRLRQ